MSQSLTIRGDILRWVRESAGIPMAIAGEHFKVTEARIAQWESEGAELTPRQLEKMATYYRRSTAVFFMPEAPSEPPLPVDFRTVASTARSLSPKTLFALRRARRTQRVFLDLNADLGRNLNTDLPGLSIEADPAVAAASIRSLLGVTIEEQLSWKNAARAVRMWRRAIEEIGVLVFQFSMPSNEARGFSLPGVVPALVVSSQDQPTARQFTLFHELAHLCVNAPGLCTPDINGKVNQSRDVETFCNEFAGHLLAPSEALGAEDYTLRYVRKEKPLMRVLTRLAARFSISRDVILRRLHSMGMVPPSDFAEAKRLLALSGTPSSGGSAPWPERPINQLGMTFVRTAFEAHERGLATQRELSELLLVKVNYIDRVHELAEIGL